MMFESFILIGLKSNRPTSVAKFSATLNQFFKMGSESHSDYASTISCELWERNGQHFIKVDDLLETLYYDENSLRTANKLTTFQFLFSDNIDEEFRTFTR